jgi:hypothetical protein
MSDTEATPVLDLPPAPEVKRTPVDPAEVAKHAKRNCGTCFGAGIFIVQRPQVLERMAESGTKVKMSKLGEREEALCGCAIKRFLKATPNIDIDLSPATVGQMFRVEGDPAAIQAQREAQLKELAEKVKELEVKAKEEYEKNLASAEQKTGGGLVAPTEPTP